MNVAIELPEDIARLLEAPWKDMPRRALEAIALEGYRTQALTCGQIGGVLGLNFRKTEAFLKQKQAYMPYDKSGLDRDRQAIDRDLSE
ncbi:MAG TPA: UPF0175 family protein [Bryobacteraceae bacterium]|nr:UPF0175 family protein [Bryobacteraceae bacterium]